VVPVAIPDGFSFFNFWHNNETVLHRDLAFLDFSEPFCNSESLAKLKGPGCPSGYDAGLTNQTSLVRFPSPLNFSEFHVILIRSLSGSESTII